MSGENEGNLDLGGEDFSPEETAEFDAEQSNPVSEISPEAQKALEEELAEFEYKVNGKVIKEKVNLKDRANIQKQFQLAKASNEAFQKAANSQKEIEKMNQEMDQFLQMLKNDPMKILSNPALGLKLEDMADKILAQKIEEASKSPETLELEKARAKLEEYEKKINEEKTARETAERQKLEADAEAHIQGEIMEAIDAGTLPKSPYIINKMAQLASIAFDNGVDISMKDLAPIVKKMYLRDAKEMLGLMADNDVEDLVSPERIKTMRNARIQAARGKIAAASKIVDVGSKPTKKTETPVQRRRLDADW